MRAKVRGLKCLDATSSAWMRPQVLKCGLKLLDAALGERCQVIGCGLKCYDAALGERSQVLGCGLKCLDAVSSDWILSLVLGCNIKCLDAASSTWMRSQVLGCGHRSCLFSYQYCLRIHLLCTIVFTQIMLFVCFRYTLFRAS